MNTEAVDDPKRLRQLVLELMAQGRFRITRHARQTHDEIPPEAKVAAILHGTGDQPNRQAEEGHPSFVCWRNDPELGLLRGVYAIDGVPPRQVVIITVFRE